MTSTETSRTEFTPSHDGQQSHLAAARRALDLAFGPREQREFSVRFWDGSVDAGHGTPRFTLIVRRPGALRRALLPPSEIALVESYLRDDLDLEGELEAAGHLGDVAAARLKSPRTLVQLARELRSLPTDDLGDRDEAAERKALGWLGRLHAHTKQLDAVQVRHHYDVGNDFYEMWLDRRMIYSCGYFPTGHETLDQAQEAKLEHICRKLRLEEGERLLDVGCGWGGLLEYAATHYGVSGVGITLSERQADRARKRMEDAGVADRVRIEVRDYRDLPGDASFDKAVSVGMREHVGAARLPGYYEAVFRSLKPGGLFLDHGLVRGGMLASPSLRERVGALVWRRNEFIEKYVFPGGELVPLGPMLDMAERTGLEARDVENLREHYVFTLRWWVKNLERVHDKAVALVGERTYRVWRLYMAATSLGFLSGRLTLIQTLFAKPHADGSVTVPLTRADLYR